MTSLNFVKRENIEEENRGFVVDIVEAFQDNIRVGYIKISYIPKANWDKHYKYAIQYQTKIGGWCPKPDDNYNIIDPKTLRSWAWYCNSCWYDNELYEKVPNMNEQELDALFWKIENYVKDKYGKSITRFKRYWVDKPHVDFINVEEKYRRQGIGTVLYFEAAKWMNERGYKFYSSTLQHKYAEEAWKKFYKHGLVKKVRAVGYPYRSRYCFDVEKLIQGNI